MMKSLLKQKKTLRSAQLEVTCGDEVITLTIIQEKFKKYILF